MSLAQWGFRLTRPFLQALDPEIAHSLIIKTLKLGLVGQIGQEMPVSYDRRLAMQVAGLEFSNPLGLAAGFDKNAEVIDAMLGLGFGFVEIGSVTPLPQFGNQRPRLFRLAEDQGIINRLGFNNQGHEAVIQRLQGRCKRACGLVGVNLGANKHSSDFIADYLVGLKRLGALGDYITLNISSPNTQGLRQLQTSKNLQNLLASLQTIAMTCPIFVKIAPDLSDQELGEIAEICCGKIAGLIVSNTTISRPKNLQSSYRIESGGLSGAPLFALSTQKLARLYLKIGGKLPLIGVGGIHDDESAWLKIRAGASLLQLYSGLVYQGPKLISVILHGLSRRLTEHGYANLHAAVGGDAENLAQ